jgi:hypothetical protein
MVKNKDKAGPKTKNYMFELDNGQVIKVLAVNIEKANEFVEHETSNHIPEVSSWKPIEFDETRNGRECNVYGTLIQYTDDFYKRNLIP